MKQPALIPILTVNDLRTTLEWFCQLGFATVDYSPHDAHVHRFDWHVKLEQGEGSSEGLTLVCDLGEHDLDDYRYCLGTQGLGPTPVEDGQFTVASPAGFRLKFCKN